MSEYELQATMYRVAIVDETHDIVAIVDPGVTSIAMMRPEDVIRAKLFCQAPTMVEKIKQLKAQNDALAEEAMSKQAEIDQLRMREEAIFNMIRDDDNVYGVGTVLSHEWTGREMAEDIARKLPTPPNTGEG